MTLGRNSQMLLRKSKVSLFRSPPVVVRRHMSCDRLPFADDLSLSHLDLLNH